jgi:hypothetical protein
LLIAILSAVVVIAVLIALGRQVLSVGRAVRRFNDEIRPLADGFATSASRAGDRVQGLEAPRAKRTS